MYHIFFCPANKAEGVEEGYNWLRSRDVNIWRTSSDENGYLVKHVADHDDPGLVVVMAPSAQPNNWKLGPRDEYSVGRGVHTAVEHGARAGLRPYLLRRAVDRISWELVPIVRLEKAPYGGSLQHSTTIHVGKSDLILPHKSDDSSDNDWAPTPIQMPTPITPPVSEPIVRPSVAWLYLNR